MTTHRGYVVIDVETSGFDPTTARVLSVAALTLAPTGAVQDSLHTLLNPGVDPGPTHVHGLTAAMLTGQPHYADVAAQLAPLLRGRILVAHNAAFDYAFLAAETRRCGAALPVTDVLCTHELASRLDLGLHSLSLAALAAHWTIPQAHPHDALDDARVLAAILPRAVARATDLGVALPIRHPATLPPIKFPTAAQRPQRRSATVSLRGVTVTVMQNTRSPVSRSQLQLYAVNIAVGAMLALGVALPVMGLAFMLTLVPSCLTTTGCDTPTAFDALVPVAGLGTWIAVTTTFAALQVHSLRRVARRRPSRKLHIR